jgi:virginiamycin B lyase
MPGHDFLALAVLLPVLGLCISILVFQGLTGVPPMPSSATEAVDVITLLRQAGLAEGAVIYELGSGWGSLAVALARAFPQAQVRGIEISPLPYWVSRLKGRGVANLSLRRGNYFDCDLSDAQAVTCYLMIRSTPRLAALLDRMLAPGTPVVALSFWFRDREVAASRTSAGLLGAAALYRWPARKTAGPAIATDRPVQPIDMTLSRSARGRRLRGSASAFSKDAPHERTGIVLPMTDRPNRDARSDRWPTRLRLAFMLLLAGAAAARAGAQERSLFAELKPTAVLKLGDSADWVLPADGALWVASTGPFAVHRIDPRTNRITARTDLPGEPCAGLAAGFGSLWVPLCGKPGGLARVDLKTGRLAEVLPIGPAIAEGGIAVSADSVWLVTGKDGVLVRIDPRTSRVRQLIHIPNGSFNPRYSHGVVWVTRHAGAVATPIDARSGQVLPAVATGRAPRFMASSRGSLWVLNQDDGSITRIDTRRRTVIATIDAGLKGHGGDIAFGGGKVWATLFGTPLTEIDAATDKVLHRWDGPGGDSLSFGYGAVWITDYRKGLIRRYPLRTLTPPPH